MSATPNLPNHARRLAPAAAGIGILLLAAGLALPGDFQPPAVFAGAAFLVVAAATFFTPDEPAPAPEPEPTVFPDLKPLEKLVGRMSTGVSATLEDIAAERDQIEQLRVALQGTLEEKRRLDDWMTKTNVETERLRNEVATWEKSVIDHFEAIARALSFPGQSEERLQRFEREFKDLSATLAATGFSVIRPEPGDRVQEGLHVVVSTEKSERPAGEIIGIERWGFQNGVRIIRPAEVKVGE